DPVAGLRHPRHLVAPRPRIEAEPDHAEPQFVAHLAHLAQVLVHLLAGLVHGFQRRAAQFELAARFEGDRTSRVVVERDDVALFGDRRSCYARWPRHAAPATPDLLSDVRHQRVRLRRQSPAIAWKTARAATAAVSARSTLGPSPTRLTMGSLPRASSSVSVKPPSGPTNSAAGCPGCRCPSAAAIGSPPPLSSQTISFRVA